MTTAPSKQFARVLVSTLLVLTAAANMFVVIPRYRRFLEGLGITPSLPSRVAIGSSRFGLGFVAIVVLAIAVAYWRQRDGRAARVATVLSSAALLAAVYLAVATCVYWDVARVMDRIR